MKSLKILLPVILILGSFITMAQETHLISTSVIKQRKEKVWHVTPIVAYSTKQWKSRRFLTNSRESDFFKFECKAFGMLYGAFSSASTLVLNIYKVSDEDNDQLYLDREIRMELSSKEKCLKEKDKLENVPMTQTWLEVFDDSFKYLQSR